MRFLEHGDGDGVEARDRRALTLVADADHDHHAAPADGSVALQVPPDVIRAKCAPYRRRGKPWHRSRLQNLDDYDIVRIYGAEYRGIVNYYRVLPWEARPAHARR